MKTYGNFAPAATQEFEFARWLVFSSALASRIGRSPEVWTLQSEPLPYIIWKILLNTFLLGIISYWHLAATAEYSMFHGKSVDMPHVWTFVIWKCHRHYNAQSITRRSWDTTLRSWSCRFVQGFACTCQNTLLLILPQLVSKIILNFKRPLLINRCESDLCLYEIFDWELPRVKFLEVKILDSDSSYIRENIL
jgi:hypothetical protein